MLRIENGEIANNDAGCDVVTFREVEKEVMEGVGTRGYYRDMFDAPFARNLPQFSFPNRDTVTMPVNIDAFAISETLPLKNVTVRK